MTSALYIRTRKEVRALLPWWLGVMLATVAMSYVAVQSAGVPFFRYDQQVWLLTVYLAGVLVLAALSVGQELTHGTLASLLVQPVDRRRVLWTKLAVLAALLFALGIAGEVGFPRGLLPLDVALRPLSIWGPVAIGIGLVPLFTLLTRKPLAGPVFAVVVPGLMYVIAERYYFAGGTAGLTVTWYGTLIVSAIGFVALGLLFPRAEVAGEGRASSSNRAAAAETPAAPFVSTGASRRTRSWVWLAIVKELRLQQMTFAVSGLFVLLGAVIVVAQRMDPPYAGPGVGALAALHGVIVAMIAGSRASAEERHLGVLAAQALHPRAAWQQWFLKVGVTLSVVLLLATALPWLFNQLHADVLVVRRPHGLSVSGRSSAWFGLESEYFFGVALACLAALYVSSLSSNSLWALLACLPATGVVMAVMAAAQPMVWSLRRAAEANIYSITPAMQENYRDPGWRGYFNELHRFRDVQDYVTIILTVGVTLLVLYLGHRNHRTLERGARRIAIQAGLIAASLVVAVATYFGASHLVWSIIR